MFSGIWDTYMQNLPTLKTCDIRLRYLDYYDF